MGRAILAVIVGYVVMGVVIFVSFTAGYMALGQERTFQPGTVDPTPTWLTLAIAISIVAAILGGVVAALIARPRSRPVKVLAGLVLILGLVSAVVTIATPRPPVPEGPITAMEAAQHARQPTWYAVLLPFIGCVGVLTGGALVKRDGGAGPR